jgi:transcriptional regulator with XRE-family HTH domain
MRSYIYRMTKRIRKAASGPKQKRRIRKPVEKTRLRTDSLDHPDDIAPPQQSGGHALRKARSTAQEEIFKAGLAEGMTPAEIAKVLGVSVGELRQIERRVLTTDGQEFISKSTAYRFYEYALQQGQNIRDLEYFIALIYDEFYEHSEAFKAKCRNPEDDIKLPTRPSIQAAIMAVKAKSDIYDKTMRMGQEMGIIEKRAKEVRVSGDINLAALDTEDLRVMLSKKLKEMDRLVSKGEIPSVFNKMLRGANARRLSSGTRRSERDADPDELAVQ